MNAMNGLVVVAEADASIIYTARAIITFALGSKNSKIGRKCR